MKIEGRSQISTLCLMATHGLDQAGCSRASALFATGVGKIDRAQTHPVQYPDHRHEGFTLQYNTNRVRGSMARKDPYAWGEERPSARKKRLRRLTDQTDLEIKAARAAYDKAVAGIRARKASLLQECERIDRCLNARGEYDPILAKAVAPGSWNSNEIPVKRPRGRPRTRFPGDPPPPRKSRAKAGGRRGRRSSARARANVPAPVLTAEQMPIMPSRGALPRAAAVFLPKSAGLPANDNRLPQPEPAPPKKVAPKFATYQGPDKALAHEEAQRQQKAAREDAFVEYERRANEITKAAEMRQGLSTLYDLSDPCDPTKMPDELLALYPHFNEAHKLPAAIDPLELTDDTLFNWIRIVSRDSQLAKEEQPEEDAKEFLNRVYGGSREFIKRFDRIRNKIIEERLRREAWHWANMRLLRAARLSNALQSGCELDKVRSEFAEFDYQTEAALAEGYLSDDYRERWKPKLREVYVRIVNALRWAEHLSRREILLWAHPERDPDVLVAYSPFDDPLERVSAWQSPDKLRHKLR